MAQNVATETIRDDRIQSSPVPPSEPKAVKPLEYYMDPRTPTNIMKPYDMTIRTFLDPTDDRLTDPENSDIPTIFNTDVNAKGNRKRKTKKGERLEKFNGIIVAVWTGFGFPAITLRKFKNPKRVWCPILGREKTVWFEIGDGSHRSEFTFLYIKGKEPLIIPKASAHIRDFDAVRNIVDTTTGESHDIAGERFTDLPVGLRNKFLDTQWIFNIYDPEWASNSLNWSNTCARANCTTALGEYELLRMTLCTDDPKFPTAMDFISDRSFTNGDYTKNSDLHPLFKVKKTSVRHDANEEGEYIDEKENEASFFEFALKSYVWAGSMYKNLPIKNFTQDSFVNIKEFSHKNLTNIAGTETRKLAKDNWDLLHKFCKEAKKQNVKFSLNFTTLKTLLFLLYRWQLIFNDGKPTKSDVSITDMRLFVKAFNKAKARLESSTQPFRDSTIKDNVKAGSSKDGFRTVGEGSGYGYNNLLSNPNFSNGYFQYGLFLVETVGLQLDYMKEDYGLSVIGVKIKHTKRALTKHEKLQVLGLQTKDDDLIYCYVDKKPVVRDEGVFAHVVSHADGGETTVDNIKFVRKCYNSESGSQNLNEFKKKVDKRNEV